MRLIDADELKTELTLHYAHLNDKAAHTSIELDRMMYINTATGVIHAINKLNNTPTVTNGTYEQGFRVGSYGRLDEIRPHGEWIPNDKISPWGNPGRSCSLCGKIVEFSENFCPKCGADMRGIYNGKKETT